MVVTCPDRGRKNLGEEELKRFENLGDRAASTKITKLYDTGELSFILAGKRERGLKWTRANGLKSNMYEVFPAHRKYLKLEHLEPCYS